MSCPKHDMHTHSCVACRHAHDDARFIHARIAELPAPALSAQRRAALAAEVMARADLHDDTHALANVWPRRIAIAGAIALAAAVALLVMPRDRPLSSRLTRIERVPAPIAVAPAPARSPVEAPVAVHEEITPVPVPAPHEEPPPRADDRRVDGARQVFGATTAKQGASVDRETLVEDAPLAAFRIGWEALRERRFTDAIAAFDRATDPAVAEDATFWAAIAAQRAGDIADARKRLDGFLTRFPDSPRADDARKAREVLR